eukprot:TRINITY_DN2384_c0_g1_i1.p1 TRINITY_DN2384_c0_g1~~TRINITY_DN2384_c0_g1_i1.p1  ORF type:complete len:425 (+),score=112.18 TRINITY_DN2384_c0_g1_i1:447-1721(+)
MTGTAKTRGGQERELGMGANSVNDDTGGHGGDKHRSNSSNSSNSSNNRNIVNSSNDSSEMPSSSNGNGSSSSSSSSDLGYDSEQVVMVQGRAINKYVFKVKSAAQRTLWDEAEFKRNAFLFGQDMIMGGIAAGMSKTMMAPLERTKIVLQTQHASLQISPAQRYTGLISVLRRIPREPQGFMSFWRGNTVNITRYFGTQALNFGFNERYRFYLRKWFGNGKCDPEKKFGRFFATNLLAGGAAGFTTLCLVYPFDYIRTRLAADVGIGRTRHFYGSFNCIAKTIKSDGIAGLYRGFGVSCVGVIVYRSLYFGCFDTAKYSWVKLKGAPKSAKEEFYRSLGVGLAVTTLAGFVSYPFDSVRRLLMMQSVRSPHYPLQYNTAAECSRWIRKTGGLRGYFRGGGTNAIRGIGAALVLVMFDFMKKASV